MITIQLLNALARIQDGTGPEGEPMKAFIFVDRDSGIQVVVPMTADAADVLRSQMSGVEIAREIPRMDIPRSKS